MTAPSVESRFVSRREMLSRGALSFGALALAGLLHEERRLSADSTRDGGFVQPSRRPTAKQVVFIFIGGGPSQVDTFDPKPLLQRLDGQNVPDSIGQHVPRIARAPLDGCLASPWNFRRYGESGIEVSDLFPEVGQCVDDLCIVRSCRHESPIHAPAEYLTMTGSLQGTRPSLGAWINFGLGSFNRDLPGFLVFNVDGSLRPPGIAAGFLPARYQGTQVNVDAGVPHIALPATVSRDQRVAQLDFLRALDSTYRARHVDNFELEARIRSYELAFRMQASAPEAFDLGSETEATHEFYGIGAKATDAYGKVFLQARRLIERGVRFVQVRSGNWDAHSDLEGNHGQQCRATDRPIAAFLRDLKQRGLLDETLVIWGGEFGRTPTYQKGSAKPGRDHSPSGYSMWLAGGGVQGGQVIGRTDDVGYAAIERPVHPNDLQATILHALGIEQRELYYEHHGRKEIVTVNGGQVVHEVFGDT